MHMLFQWGRTTPPQIDLVSHRDVAKGQRSLLAQTCKIKYTEFSGTAIHLPKSHGFPSLVIQDAIFGLSRDTELFQERGIKKECS